MERTSSLCKCFAAPYLYFDNKLTQNNTTKSHAKLILGSIKTHKADKFDPAKRSQKQSFNLSLNAWASIAQPKNLIHVILQKLTNQ